MKELTVEMANFIPHDVFGWFDFPDVYVAIANSLPANSTFVEVGSWMGKSTIFMAKCFEALNKGNMFYCVDTWQGSIEHTLGSEESNYFIQKIEELKTEGKTPFNVFMENLVAFQADKLVFPITKPSVKAATYFKDRSVHGVFLDAGHAYEDVLADLKAWFPKMAMDQNTFFGGHDYYWGEVNLAIRQFVAEMADFGARLRVQTVGEKCWRLLY